MLWLILRGYAMNASVEKPRIVLARRDYERLDNLISGMPAARQDELAGLQDELDRAELVDNPADVPSNVVKLGSIVRFRNTATGEEVERRLGFPAELNQPGPEGISILTPAGSALLGLAVGQSIDWVVEGKSVQLLILAVE
jgi:regulator of nucleoside diphosphate kinase